MTPRHRLSAVLRATLVVLILAAALAGTPVLIAGLSRWVPVPDVDCFHYNADDDAPGFAQQVHLWTVTTVDTIRLDLDDRARGILAIILVLGGSWLGLLGLTLSELWSLARNGADALRDRAARWGPRGWVAGLLASLVLSGAASPAYATTASPRPAATAPQHPHHAPPHGHRPNEQYPATPGNHTHPPPREPGVQLPADIRPDCPRYRITRGDSLSRIAGRELGTMARLPDLVRLNAFQLGRNPDHLEPGWEILLPPGTTPHQAPTKVITVAPGDTLWSIAEHELGTPNRWGQLWDLNLGRTQPDGLQLRLPDRLHPGWELVIPDEPHHKPPTGYTSTTPPPSKDPAVITPWPEPFPPRYENHTPDPNPDPPPGPPPSARSDDPNPSPDHTTAPHTQDRHDPEHVAEPTGGVEPAPGVFLGLGLAAALNVALARARRRHHSTYTPGRPFRDYQPAPTVYALRIAHLNATHDPTTGELRSTTHTHPTETDQAAVRPTPGSAPASDASPHTPLPVELGVQHEQTVHLDLAACHGLGLSGPRETDTARALLLQLLSRHTPRAEPPTAVVIPRADAELLVPDLDVAPSTVHLVQDLSEALHVLDNASARAPATQPSTQDEQDAADAHTVLIARSPTEHAHRLHTLLRDRCDLAAVLLGAWPHGLTLTTNHQGVLTHASPESSQHLRETRLFTATTETAGDLLPLTPTPRTPLPPTPPSVDLGTLTGYEPGHPASGQPRQAPPPHGNTPPNARIAPAPAPTEHTTSRGAGDEADTDRAVPDDPLDPEPATSDPPPAAVAETAPSPPTRTPQPPPLRLHVFGGFRLVWTDPTGTEHELPCTRGQRVLLTYLALHPHGVARATLLEHLWAQASQPTNTFNTQLTRLRQNLGQATRGEVCDVVDTTTHGRFRLDPRVVGSDYADFDAATSHLRHAASTDEREQALHTLLRCHTGPLGADLEDYEWLQIPRYDADRHYINATSELARMYVHHDPDYTLHLLEAGLHVDPHNEALYRDIMRLQHQLDLAHTISHTYTLLQARLADLDLKPDPQTTALAEQLLQNTPSHDS